MLISTHTIHRGSSRRALRHPSRDVRRRSILPAPIGLHGLLGGTGITLRPSALTLVLFASRKLELTLKYSISLDDMSLGTLSAWTFLKRNPMPSWE